MKADSWTCHSASAEEKYSYQVSVLSVRCASAGASWLVVGHTATTLTGTPGWKVRAPRESSIRYNDGAAWPGAIPGTSSASAEATEANLADVGVFVDNLLDPSQPLIRAYETQRTTPNPSGIALISWINTAFYALFGI